MTAIVRALRAAASHEPTALALCVDALSTALDVLLDAAPANAREEAS